MWPFLFIIAIVPMFFIWSDKAVELFPGLQSMLPAKDKNGDLIIQTGNVDATSMVAGGYPGVWFIQNEDGSYIAWTLSADGRYRLAVGCRHEANPILQVTSTSGAEMRPSLSLNYNYGVLPLTNGAYRGAEMVNAVAQFKTVSLQDSAGAVITEFEVPGPDSNTVGRTISNECLLEE